MSISIIVAIAENNAIGYKNELLCHLPNDLKWFKQNTLNKRVIMGRNTFLSLPKGALPNRQNVVISDNEADKFDNCIIVNSLQQAMLLCETDTENFIIGGASIYKQFLPVANKLYITEIKHRFAADVFFPTIDYNIWNLVYISENSEDEKNKFPHVFKIYIRKKLITI